MCSVYLSIISSYIELLLIPIIFLYQITCYFNWIYLLYLLYYNMLRKQLSGSAKRKLKQKNDEQVNKLRGSMDQFIKKKQNLNSENGEYNHIYMYIIAY